MKKILLSTLLLFGVHTFALEPTDGIKIDGKEYKNIDQMAQIIDEKWAKSPQNSYSILKEKVLTLGKDIDFLSNNKNTELNKYIDYQGRLSGLDKVQELQAQIDQKNKAIEDAKKARDEKLSSLSLKALYLATITNFPDKSTKPQLKEKAESAITQEAVEKLNGIFIDSLTTGNGSKFKEQVTAKITGTLRVDTVLSDNIDRQAGLFTYLAKVSVSPLQGKYNQKLTQKSAPNTNTQVQYITNTIENQNISKVELATLNQAINRYSQSVADENEHTLESQKQIMNDFAKEYKKLSNEINDLNEEITEAKSSLDEIYKKIGYSATNPTISEAKKYLASKIDTLEKERLTIKSGELFVTKSIQSTESDNLTKDLAKMASDLVQGMINTYQKLDNFKSTTTMINGEITNDTKNQTKTLYRQIDTFWVYLVPTNGNGFDVVVVAKFKINSTKSLPKRICLNGNCAYENEMGELAIGKRFELTLASWTNTFDRYDLARVQINKKWGYINTKGEMVIPAIYDTAWDFDKNGLSSVKINGKYGFINTKGEMVIPAKYDNFNWWNGFSKNSLVAVGLNKKWGFMNTKGEMVIPAKYDDAGDFAENGLAMVKINEKWGFINTKGDMVIPAKYDGVYDFAENGLAMVEIKGKYGFINEKGKLVIPAKYEGAGYNDFFSGFEKNGLSIAILNGKYGWINSKGEMVIPAIYDDGWKGFSENGLAPVQIKGKYGFINEKGKFVIPAIYDDADSFSENGLASVKIKGKYGFINTKGEMVIPAIYDDILSFEENGLATVFLNGKKMLIDEKGNEYNSPVYNALKNGTIDTLIANFKPQE